MFILHIESVASRTVPLCHVSVSLYVSVIFERQGNPPKYLFILSSS